MLDVMKKGAAAYYAAPRTTVNGAHIGCQFPQTTPITPMAASCCDPNVDSDMDGRCDADPKAFQGSSWEALNFGLSGQHVFQYRFQSSGTLRDAVAIMSALGDQDCDGVMSTFHLVLDGDPAATESGCDSASTAGYFHDHEIE